jgi:dynein intermediate chain 3, axonemal
MCFKFNPVDPNIIVGGCINGQLVIWDISKYDDVLKSTRDEKQFQTPSIKYDVVSSIESSHRSIVQDIHWLPQSFELGHNGEPVDNAESGHKQLITASLDGTVAFWDLRYKKELKALDLTWRPFIRVIFLKLRSDSAPWTIPTITASRG